MNSKAKPLETEDAGPGALKMKKLSLRFAITDGNQVGEIKRAFGPAKSAGRSST